MGRYPYPYQLHAVLVHEGQAVSGHYWAYIKSRRRDKWLKFNDITVTEATWEELERENSDLGEWKVALDQLPGELQKYVNEDNAKFEREMFDWDEEVQRRKDAQAAKLHESTPEQPLSTTDLRQGQCALMLLYSIHKFKYSDFLFSKDCYCNFFNVVRATVIATSGL
ncbi:hypothetical protein NP493_1119g00062 [Ridgeia piscesae]|uniref:ubiquitinyl hydrolase 1 n=1 Tax=Ridgeia piscesae TaxID=27915 RepID=A0AAD9NI74_RIDPI|nr:hypothetical protein NP493_1119g00062 [Ridgeia piscesae]